MTAQDTLICMTMGVPVTIDNKDKQWTIQSIDLNGNCKLSTVSGDYFEQVTISTNIHHSKIKKHELTFV